MYYWILVMMVILQWNVRSLLANGQEFKQFIVGMQAKPDVILCAGNMAHTECGVYHTYVVVCRDRAVGGIGDVPCL